MLTKRAILLTGLGGLASAVALMTAGCSRDGATSPTASEASGEAPAKSLAVAALPPFEVAAEAPRLIEAHPRLASGGLAYAYVTPLSEGVLLRAETLAVGQADLDAEMEKAPAAHREMLRQNQFIVLEQMATGALLEQEARRELTARGEDVSNLSVDALLQSWMRGLVSELTVADAEVEAFFTENQHLLGGAPLEQVRPQLVQHLTREKQQAAIETHIRELGQRAIVAIDAEWVQTQDAAMRNNPVDHARDSGTPTMVNFGADTCRPCQMMKPFREAVANKYDGRLNVVYVHANKDQMLASRYGVQGIPHTIFFDHDGDEFESHTGMMTQDQMEVVLARMGVGNE